MKPGDKIIYGSFLIIVGSTILMMFGEPIGLVCLLVWWEFSC